MRWWNYLLMTTLKFPTFWPIMTNVWQRLPWFVSTVFEYSILSTPGRDAVVARRINLELAGGPPAVRLLQYIFLLAWIELARMSTIWTPVRPALVPPQPEALLTKTLIRCRTIPCIKSSERWVCNISVSNCSWLWLLQRSTRKARSSGGTQHVQKMPTSSTMDRRLEQSILRLINDTWWTKANSYSHAGSQEGQDGYDLTEAIARLPWCNGSIAFVGNSWLGIAQWFIAAERAPHLKCIALFEGTADMYRDIQCRGGIPQTPFWDFLSHKLCGKAGVILVSTKHIDWLLTYRATEARRRCRDGAEVSWLQRLLAG